MRRRPRYYVALLLTVVVGGMYARIAGGWSDLEFYGVGALVLTVFLLIVMVWVEIAPDGDLRRRPQA